MSETKRLKPRLRSMGRHLVIGVAAVAVLVVGMGGWAATTEIAGAVIASGRLIVASNVKKIQHPTGGVIGEILVAEGERVEAGQVLARLDPTQIRASLAILSNSANELAVRSARLEAELAEKDEIIVPDGIDAALVRGERDLFEARRAARRGEESQLRERIAQLRQETVGLTAQIAAKADEIALIGKELESLQVLYDKNLVPRSRLTELKRQEARLAGERGQLSAQEAQVRGRIAEIELQILQIGQDLRSEVSNELSEVRAKSAELVERKIAVADQLDRIDIRAPLDGIVHQLDIHTIGGVVRPADTLMLIVPEAERLTVEVRVAPQDIDRIATGQEALLLFSAFDQRTTPEIFGNVSLVAADTSADEKTGLTYYTVRIDVPERETEKLGEVRLLPGMPVEAFVQTGERTVASYLLKPLADQVRRAFREG